MVEYQKGTRMDNDMDNRMIGAYYNSARHSVPETSGVVVV